MPGDEIPQNSLSDEKDDSERGKKRDCRRYLSLLRVTGIDDRNEEGTRNRDGRKCVSTRANDLYKCGVHFAPLWS